MKIKSILFAGSLSLAVNLGYGQLHQLTMEDVVLNARTSLAPDNLKQLKWIPGSTNFSYISDIQNDMYLVQENVTGSTTNLVSLTALNTNLKSLQTDTLKDFPQVDWIDGVSWAFEHQGQLWNFNNKSNLLQRTMALPGPAMENRDGFSRTGPFACTYDKNLWVFTGNDSVNISNNSDPAIVYGKSVHREEFGITKGTFWSPKGNLLAFYRMDESMVTETAILNLEVPPATAKMIRYPVAGDPSHHVTIGIYNLKTKQTIYLNTGLPAEQYLTNIAWSPDERYVYVAVLNRGQDHMKLNRYNAATGAFEKTLFEEKDDKYIQPLHPMEFTKKGDAFIWQSRKDGFNHIYLYDTEGNLIRQLTKGPWEVTAVDGFNAKGTEVFFTATLSKPINRDFCSVNISNGAVTNLSKTEGVHQAIVSGDGKYMLDTYSALKVPRNIRLLKSDGKIVRTLLTAADPLKDYEKVDVSIFTITGADGTELYCRMFKPAVLSNNRKYPVIQYVYNGPNVQLVLNNWTAGSDFWPMYMAQHGYIVFTVDGRGSDNRGKAFEQVTFRHLGNAEMEDQVAATKYLMKLPYVDGNRIGVFGWSYGGFMTTSLMTRHPFVYKTGVAGGPVIDWRLYEVMYTERYMDTPTENGQGYFEASVLNYVENLDGKLLVIHGTSDNVVIWQHSLLFLKECVRKGKMVDYFVYPGHEHNVRGKDRIHLYNKIAGYFFNNL